MTNRLIKRTYIDLIKLALYIGASGLTSLLTIFSFKYMSLFIDSMSLTRVDWTSLRILLGLTSGYLLVLFVKNHARNTCLHDYTYKLETSLYETICRADYRSVESISGDEIMTVYTKHINGMTAYLSTYLMWTMNILTLLVYMVYVARVSSIFLVFSVTIMIGAYFLSKSLNRSLSGLSGRVYDQYGGMVKDLNQALRGKETIRSYGLQSLFKNRFQKNNTGTLKAVMTLEKKLVVLGGVSMILSFLPTVVCIFFSAVLLAKGQVTQGQMMTLIPLVNLLSQTINETMDNRSRLKSQEGAIRGLDTLLALPEEKEGQEELDLNGPPSICVDKLSFSYDGSKMAIKEVSFSIEEGQKVALVGGNGSGKSTLLKLLAGLYLPTAGSIKLACRALSDLTIDSVYKHLAYMGQECFLFSGTVRDNMTLATRGQEAEAMTVWTNKLGIGTITDQMEQGFETLLKNNGDSLSGGQRKRLCLARTLAGNQPVLLLDEATSALDQRLKDSVLLDFIQKDQARTLVYISHDFSHMDLYDKILVMEEGRLIAQGHHRDLIQESKAYLALYRAGQGEVCDV